MTNDIDSEKIGSALGALSKSKVTQVPSAARHASTAATSSASETVVMDW